MEEKRTLSFSIDSILSSENRRPTIPKFSPYMDDRYTSPQPGYGTEALDGRIRQSLGNLNLFHNFDKNKCFHYKSDQH
jgi:hypothetical protein